MKKFLLFPIMFLAAVQLFGQQDEQMSMYMHNPLAFNPAYAGSRNSISFNTVHRSQWVGWKGAPMTQWASFHMPFLNRSLGTGVHVVNDRTGARRRTGIYFDLAASVRLNRKDHRLAFGISGGADFNMFNFSDLAVLNSNDPLYGQAFNQTTGNFGAGIYYYGERHYLGISSPRLIENKFGSPAAAGSNINRRHFFIAAGYVFRLSSILDFKPSTLVKISPNAPVTFDINTSFLLYERVWIGAMYRFHEAVGLNAAVTIKRTLQIGYAYDFPINGLRTNQRGTHEIMLMVDINRKKKNYVTPRYF